MEGAYWTSWLFPVALAAVPASLLAGLVMRVTGILLFTETEYGVHELALWLLIVSFSCMALFFASFTSKPRTVNIVSFLVFAFATLFSFLIAPFNLYESAYAPDANFFLQLLVLFWPFFHYGAQARAPPACSRLTPEHGAAVAPRRPRAAHHLRRDSVRGLFSGAGAVQVVPPGRSDGQNPGGWHQRRLGRAIGVVLDVDDGHERRRVLCACLVHWAGAAGPMWLRSVPATPQPTPRWPVQLTTNGEASSLMPWFPVDPVYWGLARRRNQFVAGDTIAEERAQSEQDGSIRVYKISKTFQTTTAVKEVSMALPRGQLVALLGAGPGVDAAISAAVTR